MRSFEVAVEPQILVWARKTIGKQIDEVAARLKVTDGAIEEFEAGKKNPTLSQLENLAQIYKRPLAVFFLPQPPREPALPKDFRTLPTDQRSPLSSKTLLAIRRAMRAQSLASELREEIGQTAFRSTLPNNINPEELASLARKSTEINIDIQFQWKDERQAFKEWRRAVEKFGILVLQLSMPVEETRGFSLAHNGLPVIVVNSQDAVRARIFTLFHEYAHLLQNDGGLCDFRDQAYSSDEHKLKETFCNHFAASFLVPKDSFLKHELIRLLQNEWSDQAIAQLSHDFKVSQEVILRRLLTLALISLDSYKARLNVMRSKLPKKRPQGRAAPASKCISQNGFSFTALVLESYSAEKITSSDVADYLSINLKYLPELIDLASKG